MIPLFVKFNGLNQSTWGLAGGGSVNDSYSNGLGLVTFGFLFGEIWSRCCDSPTTTWVAGFTSVSTSWTSAFQGVTTVWTEVY